MIDKHAGFLRRMGRSEDGNIFPLTAIALVVLAGLVGGGVDMSRAYLVQNRLQNACDAGVLAGRRSVTTDGFDKAAKDAADEYFKVNFQNEPGTSGTTFLPVSKDNGDTVDGTATTVLDSSIMKLFGFDTMSLAVECTATMSIGNSDVMMVLDTTGSMNDKLSGTSQTRMEALQAAMKNFYDTVSKATTGSNARVRYGFVPYASSANVGKLIYDVNPAYIANSVTIPSREAQDQTGWDTAVYDSGTDYGEVNSGSWYYHDGKRYYSSGSCVSQQPSDTNWSDYGSSSNNDGTYINDDGQKVTYKVKRQTQRRNDYTCWKRSNSEYYIIRRTQEREKQSYETWTQDPIFTPTTDPSAADRYRYKDVTYNTTAFKSGSTVQTLTGNGFKWEGSKWDGCIEERATVATDKITFSKATGVTPSGMYDLDIDTIPNSDATRWKPLWPKVAYLRTTYSGSNTPTSAAESDFGSKRTDYCPYKAQNFQTMTKKAFEDYADALTPWGGTYHDIGMIWGTRLSSETGIFSSNVTEAPKNGGKVSRHIIFMTDGDPTAYEREYTAWGIEFHSRRVTDDGESDHVNRHVQRMLTACEIAKSKGIRVWVIAFATKMTTELEKCASQDSDFPASNAGELNKAFQEIAKQVGELRVTQ